MKDRPHNASGQEGLRHVLEALPSAILYVDGGGIVRIASDRFLDFFGLSASGTVGMPFPEIFDAVSRSFTEYTSLREIFILPSQDREKEYVKDAEVSLPKKRLLQISSRPVSEGGTPKGRVWSIRDITQEREIADLKIAYGAIRYAEELKSRFMTVISHQLRTPLSSIRWNSELFLSDGEGIPKEANEVVRRIHDSVTRSIGIVDDMMVGADIERHTLRLERSATDLPEVVRKLTRDAARTAVAKSITLSLKDMPDPVPRLFLDCRRIEVAIGSIIDNAITYSPEGRTVEIRMRADEREVAIEVADHGVGIAEEEEDRIYGMCYRTKEAMRLNPDASGLGLYIAKYIIEAHGGTIGFVSEEGSGTTFTVTLPREAAD